MTPPPCRRRCLKGVTALAASPWKAVSYGRAHSFHPLSSKVPTEAAIQRRSWDSGHGPSLIVVEFPLHPILAGPFVMVMRR